MAPSSLFIALIGYVESIAIAKALAVRHHETIHANRELLALGCANVAAAFSGTMPVAGGFSRHHGELCRRGAHPSRRDRHGAHHRLGGGSLRLLVYQNIPKAALAAIIIVAIIPLVNIKALSTLWQANRLDALILLATFFGVLLWGIEEGLTLGIGLSLLARLRRGSRRAGVATIDTQGKATETIPNGVNRDSM